MGYERKGFNVFTGSVISFLLLTSSCMASATDNTVQAVKTKAVAKTGSQTDQLKSSDIAKSDLAKIDLAKTYPAKIDVTKKYPMTIALANTDPVNADTASAAKTDSVKTTEDVSINTTSTSDAVYADDLKTDSVVINDPYEGYNRVMFDFDDRVDTTILKPVGTFYNKIMPRPLNQGIHNFFNNINNIPTAINDLLQFNFYQMANDLWRLGINSTVGIGGLFDVASRMNLEQYDNDFGLTMAKWGYRNSNYFVLPFWGPKTIRDMFGMPVDYFAFSIYPYIHPKSTRYELYALAVVDARAQHLKVENVMEEATLDKYVFVRNAYMQNRAYKIRQNDHRTYADMDKGAPVPDTAETAADNTNDGTFIPDEANTVTGSADNGKSVSAGKSST